MGKKLPLIVLAMFLTGILSAVYTAPRVNAATVRSFHLSGNYSQGWNNTSPGPTIQVYQGDTVNLTLTSQDGHPHQFFVDYNNNNVIDSGEPHSNQFTATIVYSFVADTLGNFTYRCAVHPVVMFGDFKVLTPIPEFPGALVLPLFIALTFLAVVLLKRGVQGFL